MSRCRRQHKAGKEQGQSQQDRGIGPMSPTAGIRVAFANSISISVASGTSGSNPLSSSGESANHRSRSPVEYALLAEDLDFRAVWCPEVPAFGHDIWVTLARIAERRST